MRFESFGAMLAHWAEATPDAPALRFDRGGELAGMSYAQLRRAVSKRAAALRGGCCLGVLCDGSVENVVEILAAAEAGLQVALLDGNADEALLAEQIRAADVNRLWGEDELAGALAPALATAPVAPGGQLLFFTSGTTHAAQAVALTERSLCASAWNGGALLPLMPSDTLLCMLPLNHVFGFVCGLLWGLSCGACVALGRGIRHYIDDCAFFKPTALPAVTLLLEFLVAHGALNAQLRLVLVGAGSCPPKLLEAVSAMGIRVCFGYGLTETSSGVALSLGDDPYAMTVCPDDEIEIAEDGEIIVRAATCMMRGYYKNHDATARVLRDGALYTGDIGSLDREGRLRVTGRKKEILVLRDGTKLFLPEYEAKLREALGNRDFAVVEREGTPVLVLCGDAGERAALEKGLAPVMTRLPRGQRLAGIEFVAHPLPRTQTGKIKRWEIQQKAVEA